MSDDDSTKRPGPPDVSKRPGPPDVSKRPGPPDVSKRPGPPDVSKRSGPPDVSKRPGPPDVSKRPGPPDVSKRSGPTDPREASGRTLVEGEASGFALHVGVNECDAKAYGGWTGPLAGCENDADEMLAISTSLGYDARQLKTAAATRDGVIAAVREIADRVQPGDTFLLSYAGHGGQVRDDNRDEADGSDETWCLYDGHLLDDELFDLWHAFPAGARVVVISDCCHSGTVTRSTELSERVGEGIVPRCMPPEELVPAWRAQAGLYAEIQHKLPRERADPQARVRLISGCQDDQLSGEAWGNGLFTMALKRAWDDGVFAGDWAAFHLAIRDQLPEDQQPNHLVFGGEDPAFDAGPPFRFSG